MIPWDKLPSRLQKYLLISIILSGSAATTGGCQPIVCDPAPPPPTTTVPRTNTPIVHGDTAPPPSFTPPQTATPPFTPMICDPAPPPTIATATPTPMICDPAPPPSIVRPEQQFRPRAVVTTQDTTLPGAVVQGQILDAQGHPVSGIQVTAQLDGQTFYSGTDLEGRYIFYLGQFGEYNVFVGDDQADTVRVRVAQYDRDIIDWLLVQKTSLQRLPLAEIRTVEITRLGDLAFQGDTLWPGAQLRWTVSGGTLTQEGNRMNWTPPATPGRYLLQVVADWGRDGLAVSASVLQVGADGSIAVV